MAQSESLSLPGAAAAEARAGEPDAAPKPSAHSVLSEEVLAVYAYAPATLAGLATGFGMLMVLFWATAPKALLALWAVPFVALWVVRIVLSQAFRTALHRDRGATDWARWRRYWNLLTIASAVTWGLGGFVFYEPSAGIQQTGLIIVIYTFCIAVVPVLANQPRMFIAYVVLCFGPLIGRIATGGDDYSLRLAGMLLIIVTLTTLLARNYRQALQRVIEHKLRADELLDALRIEKAAADQARHEAEVANRAKTQFFAAASHDLRQPLHAMGLFAEALRQRTQEPEVAHLVNSINGSVDALEGLFSELLDITKIDAGAIEVNPQAFEVGDILRKLRLHYEPTAFEKGLALTLRGGSRVVMADPLLVERILRNLVSNAIRYTEDGGVLVGARRRGDKVLLQVWDSGVGISEEEQKRVFEEFYQVKGGQKTVSPEGRKGLGLGLAIVRRLADLMNAPLTMRSRPGHGTVFTLELPAAARPKLMPSAVPGKGPLQLTLEGRRIVIVEDEPAVRAGLEVLLSGWGATIDAFDSVAAATAWAEQARPEQRPDLVIADYRLEAGHTGIEAIVALRRRFDRDLPAIVVTGSTMGIHDREAQDGDFHLLLKPVVPNKLRAMIAFKLQLR